MQIRRNGTQPSGKGPPEYFTGEVRIDPLFETAEPARVRHPLGQTLIVISGLGRIQSWGGPVDEIRPGDVVWCPPGEKHWHGAGPTTAMSHFAIQEALDGKVVEWMEEVGDEQYRAAPGGR
jgi:mannose-6-phosphate isomerase-like protein (cupin superfamily)